MINSTFRAVLFDFDGTLADSYAAITASVNHVRNLHGLEPIAEHIIRRMVGRGLQELVHDILPGVDPDLAAQQYREHHPSVMLQLTSLLPGVSTTLRALHKAGLRMAVCSNKPSVFTRQLVTLLGLDREMEFTLGPEDVANPKPAPDMLLTAMERLEVSPAETLYVGDMVVDIRTARAAGVKVWVVPTGSEEASSLVAAKPDRLMREFKDLLDILPKSEAS